MLDKLFLKKLKWVTLIVTLFISSLNLNLIAQAQKMDINPQIARFFKNREKYAKFIKVAKNLRFSNSLTNRSNRSDYYKTQNTFYALDSIVSDSSKTEYTYDVEGFLIETVIYSLDSQGDWVEDSKEEYYYDNNDYLEEIIYSEYDDVLSTWEEVAKFEVTYGPVGSSTKIIQEDIYVWNDMSNSWVKVYYSDLDYNLNGDLDKEEWFEYDFNTLQFQPILKLIYAYDTNGDLDNIHYYSYDENIMNYVLTEKDEYYYNTNQKLDKIERFSYDDQTNSWDEEAKIEYEYDSNGILDYEIYFTWDVNNNFWDPNEKFVYDYDVNFDNNDLILPWPHFYVNETGATLEGGFLYGIESTYFDYMLLKAEEYIHNDMLGFYELEDEHDYYYSTITITSKNANKMDNSIKLYPNPVKDKLFIAGANNGKLELYDFTGKLIFETTSSTNEINLSGLNPGHYIYKFQTQNRLYTGKIIKE